MHQHEVEIDTAGWGNWQRVTCYTCRASVLRKSYMNNKQWLDALHLFAKSHPAQEISRLIENLKSITDLTGDS